MSQHQFRDEPWAKPNPGRVRLSCPAFVVFGHPDLEKAHEFLINFGLNEAGRSDDLDTIYFAGYGRHSVSYVAKKTDAPQLLGVYYEASSEADFERATKVPGAGPITPFNGPGGGHTITIADSSGFPFGVVFGNAKKAFDPPQSQILPFNIPAASDQDEQRKPRRGTFQRITRGRIPVHTFGHGGFWVDDLDAAVRFYVHHFNFKPSDIILGPDTNPMVLFFHLDLGKEYSDHHSFILGRAGGPITAGPHHFAFEVESIDHQFVGHDFLEEKGYKSFWGVGRHIEGSQVFDYWIDVHGFLVEHYADGDLLNEDNPVNWVSPRKYTNNWGPEPPILPSDPQP